MAVAVRERHGRGRVAVETRDSVGNSRLLAVVDQVIRHRHRQITAHIRVGVESKRQRGLARIAGKIGLGGNDGVLAIGEAGGRESPSPTAVGRCRTDDRVAINGEMYGRERVAAASHCRIIGDLIGGDCTGVVQQALGHCRSRLVDDDCRCRCRGGRVARRVGCDGRQIIGAFRQIGLQDPAAATHQRGADQILSVVDTDGRARLMRS